MLHIYYGKGKGKTTCALGLITRACGYKKRIILFRFLKPKNLLSGEDLMLKRFSNVKEFRFNYPHPMFLKKGLLMNKKIFEGQVLESLDTLKKVVKKRSFDMLILDEMLNLMDFEFVKEDTILGLLKGIKDEKEIILTGRNKPKKLSKIADYITEFKLIRHPFQKGIIARKTIEY